MGLKLAALRKRDNGNPANPDTPADLSINACLTDPAPDKYRERQLWLGRKAGACRVS